jgi:hypothetical protein
MVTIPWLLSPEKHFRYKSQFKTLPSFRPDGHLRGTGGFILVEYGDNTPAVDNGNADVAALLQEKGAH